MPVQFAVARLTAQPLLQEQRLLLAAGCQGGQREDGGTTSTGPTSAEEPEPSQTRSPVPEQTYRPVRFDDGPVFNEPLADDVTTAQLQRLGRTLAAA